MIKTQKFCDRCKEEVEELETYNITGSRLYFRARIEVCLPCDKILRRKQVEDAPVEKTHLEQLVDLFYEIIEEEVSNQVER